MCGITGFINLNQETASNVILKKMTDAIRHRGPDGEGNWIEDNVALGHRRLAIIDLTTSGEQPMFSDDGRYVMIYNGEVYNFRELKLELEEKGYFFNSKTDSEVVLKSFVHWGKDAVLKFNGMFSIAIWDRVEKKLFLARDRYGVKPLYWLKQGPLIAFGSEQKAILAHPKIVKKLNRQALIEYFTFQNIFTNQTLLEDINIFPPGHYAIINSQDYVVNPIQYWDFKFNEPKVPKQYNDYFDELDFLFKQAVNRQLVSDVELGAYLSGGIDSGSITALAAKQFPNLKSFTCGFDLSSASGIELAFDERSKAEAMSSLYKTEHYQMVLKSGDMERCLPELAYHLEEPRVGQSYPNFYAAKLASKFVKVVLSGSGGDELFGGYPWRYYSCATSQNFDNYIDQYYLYWQRLVNNVTIKQIFKPVWSDVKNISTKEIFRSVFSSHDIDLVKPEDFINHSLYFEAKTFLHGLFVVEDKLSMAHGLESRVPFMDNDLVDFAMNCPVKFKLNNLSSKLKLDENEVGIKQEKYFQMTSDGKQILRNVMSQYVPFDIINGKKQGFSSPDSSWFKGESIDFVRRELFNKNAPIYDFLDYKTVESLLLEHLHGKQNRRLLIWSLLNVNIWMKENLT
jgi:asparagine synthase (glutamine-hydrolysing)